MGLEKLRLRLDENLDDFTKDSDAHLLNHQDEFGDLPEYIPYSLVSYGF